MKSVKISSLTAVVLIMISFASCDKGNENNQPQPDGAILPAVISYTYGASATPDTNGKTLTFEYDAQNRISKIRSELFYNGVSHGFVSTLSLEYDANRITATTTRSDLPADWGSDKVTYPISGSQVQANGRFPIKLDDGKRALNYQRWDNRRYYEFKYDAKGNATSVRGLIVATGEVKESYTLMPGESNGVFLNVKTPAWFITSQLGSGAPFNTFFDLEELSFMQLTNNCIESAEVDGQAVYEYNYTLNDEGFPTQIIRNPNFEGTGYVRYDIEYTTEK